MKYKGFIIFAGIIDHSYEGLIAQRHGIRIEAPFAYRLDIDSMELTIDDFFDK